jgi:two-component system, NtrC family, response regulator GlrR
LPVVLRGSSAAAERQRRELVAAAEDDAPAVVIAEPGLEPETVARAVHAIRAAGPFVVLDCGSATAGELHDRLFGAPETISRRRDLERLTRSAGLVTVGAGTLVLSRVTELPAGVQRRLARVLRDGEVYVGDARHAVPLRARLIATMTPEVDEEVATGRFRADLFRRLSGHRIVLAPLRDRGDDMPDILREVADEIARQRGSVPRAFTTAALTALAALPWQRNLDELRELLDRLHAAAPGVPARQEDVLNQLGLGLGSARPARFDNLRDARKRFEREYIAAVLARHQWRMAEAATTLGIERANLYRKVRQLGLSRPSHGIS